MKVIIVGGVAGGATAAARIRRNDETAEILMIERGQYISFANCGLPYHLGHHRGAGTAAGQFRVGIQGALPCRCPQPDRGHCH